MAFSEPGAAVGADGQNQRTLVTLPGNAWGPRIAPDGRYVAPRIPAVIDAPEAALGGIAGHGPHEESRP